MYFNKNFNETNTMEKIENLLAKLNGKVSNSLRRRLESREKLLERLDLAKSEHDSNPTEESEETLAQIQDYVDDVTEDLIEDLEAEIKQIEVVEQPKNPVVEQENEEKNEGSGILTLVIGGVLLVASLGAINYFRKQ